MPNVPSMGTSASAGSANTGNANTQSRNTTSAAGTRNSSMRATTFSDGPQDANPLPSPVQESLRINVDTANFKAIDRKGFSEQRPEILAAFQLEPVYQDRMTPSLNSRFITNPVGEMLDLQISSRKIRAENILRLINELKANPDTAPIVEQIENRIESLEAATSREIAFLIEMVRILDNARDAFSVKTNDQLIKERVATRRVQDRRGGTRAADRRRSAKSPGQILTQELGFSSEGLRHFTNTKMLAQLLDDLRVIMTSFSPQIFDVTNEERIEDRNSTRIIKLDDPTEGAAVGFDISSMASTSAADVASGATRVQLDRFLASLASVTEPDDRMRILFNVLSKELRVSTGLSTDAVSSTLANVFNSVSNEGDVFARIIGQLGNDVLQINRPDADSIASLLRVIIENGDNVLPFEPLVTKSGIFPTYIPGRTFYVDSILRGETKFDTTSLEDYARALDAAMNGLALVTEGTLDVNVTNRQRLGLNVRDIVDQVVNTLRDSVNFLRTANSTAVRDFFTPALLNAAQTNTRLKHFLYLYLLVLGYERVESLGVESAFFDTLENAGLTKDVIREELQEIALAPIRAERDAIARNSELGLDVAGNNFRDFIIGADKLSADEFEDFVNTSNAPDLAAGLIVDQLFQMFGEDVPRGAEFNASSLRTGLAQLGGDTPHFLFTSMFEIMTSLDEIARRSISGTPADANSDGYFSNEGATKRTTPGTSAGRAGRTVVSSGNRGLTKFNRLGAHTIVMIVLEIFTTFFSKFPISTIIGAVPIQSVGSRNRVVFEVDGETLDVMDAMLANFQNRTNFVFGPDFTDDQRERIFQSTSQLQQIASKATREDNLIRDIVDVLVSISNNIGEATQEAARFFRSNGPNAAILNQLLTTVDADDKLSALDDAQVTLARIAQLEHTTARAASAVLAQSQNQAAADASEATPFTGDSTILPGVRNALFKMMAQPAFRGSRGQNAQILSVGLPAGFTDSLRQRSNLFISGQDLTQVEGRADAQQDVIRVNVFMQDMLFDDLVFRPRSFIFEIGRFVKNFSMSDVKSGEIFTNDVNQVITQHVLTADGRRFESLAGLESTAGAEYSFLNDTEKRNLTRNHVHSYLLGIYVRLLAGVNMSEDEFLLNKDLQLLRGDETTKDLFRTLITTHISQFVAEPQLTLEELADSNEDVRDLLTRLDESVDTEGVTTAIGDVIDGQPAGANIEISQDLVTFMNTFSPNSIIFGAGARRQRTVSPKTFERIFNILVDPDDFEIDVAATTSTRAGQSMLDHLAAARKLENVSTGQVDPAVQTQSSGQPGNIRDEVRLNRGSDRPGGNVSFQQFFVTIEQLPEQAPLAAEGSIRISRTGTISTQIPRPGTRDREETRYNIPRQARAASTRRSDRGKHDRRGSSHRLVGDILG